MDPSKVKTVKKSKELSHEQFRLKERAGTEWEDSSIHTGPQVVKTLPLVDLLRRRKKKTLKSWKGPGKKEIKAGRHPKEESITAGKVPKTGKPVDPERKYIFKKVRKKLGISKKKTESEY